LVRMSKTALLTVVAPVTAADPGSAAADVTTG